MLNLIIALYSHSTIYFPLGVLVVLKANFLYFECSIFSAICLLTMSLKIFQVYWHLGTLNNSRVTVIMNYFFKIRNLNNVVFFASKNKVF